MKGAFFTFEGIDGSGKSLMQKLLAQDLRKRGYSVLTTREPGGTVLGGRIRRMLLDSEPGDVDERTEALLYAADRALHVAKVIKPALAAGKIVLCDRYIDSSFAYQGSGRMLDMEDLRRINYFAADNLMPQRTFYLEISYEQARSRLSGEKDRMEREEADFFKRIAAAYRKLAEAEPERFIIINAAAAIPQVRRAINSALFSCLGWRE